MAPMAPGSPPASETQYPGQTHDVARGPARAQHQPSPQPLAVPKPAAKESAVGCPASDRVGMRPVGLRHCPRHWCARETRNGCPCNQVRRRIRGRRSGHSSGRRGRRAARRKGQRARGSRGPRSPAHKSTGARHRPPGTCRRWRRRGHCSHPGHARSVARQSQCGSGSARRGPGRGRGRLWGEEASGARPEGAFPQHTLPPTLTHARAHTIFPVSPALTFSLCPSCLHLTPGPTSESEPGAPSR